MDVGLSARDLVGFAVNREPVIDTSTSLPPSRVTDWPGTDRYRVRRCIGTGAVGAVYEAEDVERQLTVAVKRLRHFSPATLYLLKQEFRTLADVHHANLVRLYELVATDRDVFFTMELVRGVDLVTHARPKGAADHVRLRHAMSQLVEGVQALHTAGKLHRDIKPSNVLVTAEGRVVLLDFGVATELSRGGDDDDLVDGQPIVGTASYIAPEQAAGAAPSPTSDWYGVGAILFEALVGSAPFLGSVSDVLRMKARVPAPLPSTCVGDVPPDLDALCGALLQRAADARPTGPEILRLLGVSRHAPRKAALSFTNEAVAAATLVSRREPMLALREAFEISRTGRSVTVRVRGTSGMGKSTLVHEFLDGLVARGEALVLRGRAYERESVPYKAIDGWVDALSRHLLKLSDRGALVPLPADVWALARLFPVLLGVPEIREAQGPAAGDPHRVRRRAFGALRELLASLAGRQPLVVFIDDVHWGDADSAALLLELVRPPQAPGVLFVMTNLEEGGETSPFLAETRANWPRGAEARDVNVGPLAPEDAGKLALALLATDDDAARATAAAVARESHGSPFLVEELVRGYQGRASGATENGAITLEESVAQRVALLPAAARTWLEIIAVGGLPLPVTTVSTAAADDADAEEVLTSLRAQRFVRVGLRRGCEVVEVAHNRIRDTIVSALPGERTRFHHRRLAAVLEATPNADPEAVAIQLLGAGEHERLRPYAERAAEEAMRKLAFDRAVQLLRLALEGAIETTGEAKHTSVDAARLRERLAVALAWAGRGAESARAYLDAAEKEPGARRIELERAAAEQLLASGRIDEGARVLHRVLAAIGTTAPASTLAALFWLVIYRFRLTLTRVRFEPRPSDEVHPADRARIEAMYAVAMGFAIVDVLLGACMQARVLLLALRAGDRRQVLRGAGLEAAQMATMGGIPKKRERRLVELAERMADQLGDVESRAFVDGVRGVQLFLRGRWKEARDTLDASSAQMPNSRNEWYTNANLFAVRSLYFSGELRELFRRQARAYADAHDRGDLYVMVNFAATTRITMHLAGDDPEAARQVVREGMAQWSQTGFLVQHWQAMAFEPDIDLYVGDGAAAYDRLLKDMPALRRSFLLHVQFVRGLTFYARGRCAVAAIAQRPGRRRALVAEGREMARRLERERMPWTTTFAAIVSATTENAAGNRAATVEALRRAVDTATAAGMTMHAAAARYRLAELLGGEEGAALRTNALQKIEGEGIRDSARWVAIYLPGQWGH